MHLQDRVLFELDSGDGGSTQVVLVSAMSSSWSFPTISVHSSRMQRSTLPLIPTNSSASFILSFWCSDSKRVLLSAQVSARAYCRLLGSSKMGRPPPLLRPTPTLLEC